MLANGEIDLIDELLASDYVSPAMGDADREGFEATLGFEGSRWAAPSYGTAHRFTSLKAGG
jgi:hypothetical protein